jgi:decaprenylphospho-beta-D-erythro-pentofuranosid-2-ulose 2-reductase
MRDAFGHPQSVVVLGGTSEIAGALVDRLVADRCRTVVLAGRDSEALERAAQRAKAGGADDVRTVEFDALDLDHVGDVVSACLGAAGDTVDWVVLALGHLGDAAPDGTDPGRIAESIAVNFAWPAAALGPVAQRLRAQGYGRIVVLSSVAGVRIRVANFIYGSAKAGLDGFARGLAQSLEGSGVQLHVVRPGFVHTKMTAGLRPAPFAVGPGMVAAAVLRGIERDQPVIWVPSTLRWVFVVLRALPQWLWRRLPG